MSITEDEVRCVADVMTLNPEVVAPNDLVRVAAKKMRDAGVGDVIVVEEGTIVGILTDRDIVTRLVAAGQDPTRCRVRDAYSRDDITVLVPEDILSEAVSVIRKRAVRRLPVVVGGRPVGIVSLGDLALVRDPSSALADVISATVNG
jgi:CBS domain-containing protein